MMQRKKTKQMMGLCKSTELNLYRRTIEAECELVCCIKNVAVGEKRKYDGEVETININN